ncbi:MAG: LPS export ABC transporter permease LptG [Burkholderiaceae bacterium]
MRLIGGYLIREIALGISMVLVGFLGLFAFFDLVRELDDVGKAGYKIQHAIAYVALGLPSHVYELMPVAALIGCIYALAQFASSSEFTAMRAAGMSRAMALRSVIGVGIVLALLTAMAGEWVAPVAQQLGASLRLSTLAKAPGGSFRSGLWIKDSRVDPVRQTRVNRFINIGRMRPDGVVERLEIYEFDEQFRLETLLRARSAEFRSAGIDRQGPVETARAAGASGASASSGPATASAPPETPSAGGSHWMLKDVERTVFTLAPAERGGETLRARYSTDPFMRWESELNPELLAVLTLDPDRMSAFALWRYVQHLKANGQNANRYEVALWKKVIYPVAIVIMLMLALPFGYIQARAGSVGLKLFTGIMIGVAFYFFNGLMSNLGLLNTWPPWVAVSVPSAVAFGLALIMLTRVGRAT